MTKKKKERNKNEPRRVLVLGSGISGLACAQELKYRNWQVLVVEARHRPGGRLKSLRLKDKRITTQPLAHLTGQGFRPAQPFQQTRLKQKLDQHALDNDGGRSLDLGGQFIHGIRHNPIYSMTQTLGLTAHSMSSCQLLTNQGDILSKDRDVKMEAAFNQVLSQTWHDCQSNHETLTNNHASPQNNVITSSSSISSSSSSMNVSSSGGGEERKGSFGKVFERRARDMARSLHFSPEDHNVFQWHVTNLELSCGTSLENLGYTWNDDEAYGYTGQHVLLEQSFGSLIQSLSSHIPIQYGCPVVQIQLVKPPSTSAPSPPSSNHTTAPSSTLFTPPEPTKRKRTATSTTATTTNNNAKPPPQRRRRIGSVSVSVSKPQRQSARLTGDTSHLVIPRENDNHHSSNKDNNNNQVRRSSRSHRQTPTRFTIDSLDAAYSYDNPQLTTFSSSKKKKPKNNARSIPKVKDKGNDDDNEDEEERTKVRVTLESGLVLEADAVVCTLPVGVLKLEAPHDPDAITFDPPLPERKRLAIQRLGCGRFNKCALLFDRVFWHDSDFIGFTATPATHILVTNLCRPASSIIPDQQDSSSLSAATAAAAPILIMYYGGAHAHDMEELRDVQVVDDCMQVLRDNFGTDLVPDQPLDYAVTRWGMERYSRGAFSFVPPGVHGETELDLCGEPIYDPYQSNIVGTAASATKSATITINSNTEPNNHDKIKSTCASDAHTQQKDVDPSNSSIATNTSNTTAKSSNSSSANNHVPVALGSASQHVLAGDGSLDPLNNGKADGEHENKNEQDAVIGSSSTSTSSSINAVGIEQSPVFSEDRNENDLSNIIQRPVILFAGEHTTPYHPSTIHGAFSSGIREAYRLDVSWEPALNQNMSFDKTFLYQRTFPLKRRKQREKKEREQRHAVVTHKNIPPPAQATSRTVTTEGGMKLRKRTSAIMNGSDKSGMPSGKKRHDHHHRTGGGNALQMNRQPQPKRAPEPQQSSSGVRRSNRQISRFLQDRQYKGDRSCHTNGAGTRKEEILVDGFSVAEDICLLRAVDTFSCKDSDAWDQIRTKTFDETKSGAQLEARYKTLVEEGADLDPSRWNQLPSSSLSKKEYDAWSKANWSLSNDENESWLAPKEVQPLFVKGKQQKPLTLREAHPTTMSQEKGQQQQEEEAGGVGGLSALPSDSANNDTIRRSSRRRSSHWNKYDDTSDE